jgi:hypothetical protein
VTDAGAELDQLRLAVGEVEALANLVQESFDRADWGGADSLVIDRLSRHSVRREPVAWSSSCHAP